MILYLCASVGKNLELTKELHQIGEDYFESSEIVNLVNLDLPLYSTIEEKNGIPENAKSLTEKMIHAKALVYIAPEYNGLIPPVLNNAIAWVSRSGGEDWRAAFNGKLAVIATHSGGGGDKALNAMRMQLQHLGTTVLARQLLTHYQKALNPESAQAIFMQLKSLIK